MPRPPARTRSTPPLTDAEFRALARFRRALRGFLAVSEANAKSVGITANQHQLLVAIRGSEDGPPSIGELADWLRLQPHSVVELVDRAEAGGLVERRPDDADGRRQRLVLTPTGARKLDELSAMNREELRRFREEGLGALRDY